MNKYKIIRQITGKNSPGHFDVTRNRMRDAATTKAIVNKIIDNLHVKVHHHAL